MKITKLFIQSMAKSTRTQDHVRTHTYTHTHLGSHAHNANKEHTWTGTHTHMHAPVHARTQLRRILSFKVLENCLLVKYLPRLGILLWPRRWKWKGWKDTGWVESTLNPQNTAILLPFTCRGSSEHVDSSVVKTVTVETRWVCVRKQFWPWPAVGKLWLTK